ncbi:uncharacterized protein FSUBG_3964 [Fusarium subglutinans]|uniref:Uncharacterized protein n=1 Tax=Gibberella subglutinans TaxID=42677 RepID=A0A8H5Q4P5_GIBSU|nr:uncharacterized protein FSUBG_3964 [Fusarium subglutinans]KAF5609490.1 hypothetical protein FSUBG_3964 [Fusarium subglutinans]
MSGDNHDHGGQDHGGGGGDDDAGDFGLAAAPHLEPEVGLEWPDFQNPEIASVGEIVLSGQLRFVARQNQALMSMVQNLYSAISKFVPLHYFHSFIPGFNKLIDPKVDEVACSSTGTSSDGGDPVHLKMPDENAERVSQAYQALIEGGEIYDTIEEKQSAPAGQEDVDLVERQDVILTNLKLLTPDLITDLYIMLNKAKKASGLKDQPDKSNKGKRKAKGKKTKDTGDGTSADVGAGGHHESDDGNENRNLESARTTAGGPSCQLLLNSQASSLVKRSLRSRQISGSSGVGAAASSQQSQASATTIQRRRSKQKTRFIISDNKEDEDAEDEL